MDVLPTVRSIVRPVPSEARTARIVVCSSRLLKLRLVRVETRVKLFVASTVVVSDWVCESPVPDVPLKVIVPRCTLTPLSNSATYH